MVDTDKLVYFTAQSHYEMYRWNLKFVVSQSSKKCMQENIRITHFLSQTNLHIRNDLFSNDRHQILNERGFRFYLVSLGCMVFLFTWQFKYVPWRNSSQTIDITGQYSLKPLLPSHARKCPICHTARSGSTHDHPTETGYFLHGLNIILWHSFL